MSCGFLNPKNSIKFYYLCLLQSSIFFTVLTAFHKVHFLIVCWEVINRPGVYWNIQCTGIFYISFSSYLMQPSTSKN